MGSPDSGLRGGYRAGHPAAGGFLGGGGMINDVPTFRVDHMPYGGIKGSGMGREGVKYAIHEMTELKMVTIREMEWETGGSPLDARRRDGMGP